MSNIEVDVEKVDAAVARGATALDFPRTRISDTLDWIVGRIGELFSWIWVLLIGLIVLNVVLRYVIGTNFIALEELQWHLYAVGFMMGLSYCILKDGHVRVDVLAERASLKTRAWIEMLGLLLLLLPFIWVVFDYAIPFVERSWRIGEVSAAPGGLPMRWLIKSVILVAFTFMAMAAISRLLRITALLFGLPRPRGGAASP